MQVLTRSSVKKTLALSSRKGEKKPTSRHQGPNLTRGITVAADQTISIKNSWRERSSLHNTWKGTERKVLPPFRNLREGAPGDTPPSIPLVFLGLGVAGSCGDRPGDPGRRGPAQPLSALRSTASPPDYQCRLSPPVAIGPCALGLGSRWQTRRSRRPRRRKAALPASATANLNEKLTPSRAAPPQTARAMGTSLVVHHCDVGTTSCVQGCQRESAALSPVRRYA